MKYVIGVLIFLVFVCILFKINPIQILFEIIESLIDN